MKTGDRLCGVLFVLCAFAVTSGQGAAALWKLLFRDHRKWTGSYNFNNIPFACHLYVRSVQMDDSGVAYISFRADGVKMDVTGDPNSEDQVPTVQTDRSFSLGLAIGLPVTLGVILMITGVGIGYWAFKKGYFRHVPMSYKNFRNPRSTEAPPVSFEPKEPTNVHI